ncbi:MAG: hypothetical protein WBP81_36275 [Solirubrobacteraceae bacterium]
MTTRVDKETHVVVALALGHRRVVSAHNRSATHALVSAEPGGTIARRLRETIDERDDSDVVIGLEDKAGSQSPNGERTPPITR